MPTSYRITTATLITGPKKKIEDVKYQLTPSLSFISQMKKANLRQKEITQKALDLGVLSYQTLGEEYARELNEAGGPQKAPEISYYRSRVELVSACDPSRLICGREEMTPIILLSHRYGFSSF